LISVWFAKKIIFFLSFGFRVRAMQLISEACGDTDTSASFLGLIAGSLVGYNNLISEV
jgi:hypothetical protein